MGLTNKKTNGSDNKNQTQQPQQNSNLGDTIHDLVENAVDFIETNVKFEHGLPINENIVFHVLVRKKGRKINENLKALYGINSDVVAHAWQRVMEDAIELDKNSSTSDTDAVSSNSSVDFHTERINRPSVLTEIVRNATKEADQPKNPAGIKRCYVTDITGSDRKEFKEEPGDDGVSRSSCSTNYKVATLTVVMEDGTEQDYKMPALLLLIARYGLGDILSMLGKDGHFEIMESKPKVLGDYRSCIKVNDNVFIVCHSMMIGCEHIAALRDIFAVHKFPKSKAHTLYDSEEYETILGEIVHPSSTTYDEAWWYGRNTILAMDKKPFERILRDLTMHLPAIRW